MTEERAKPTEHAEPVEMIQLVDRLLRLDTVHRLVVGLAVVRIGRAVAGHMMFGRLHMVAAGKAPLRLRARRSTTCHPNRFTCRDAQWR